MADVNICTALSTYLYLIAQGLLSLSLRNNSSVAQARLHDTVEPLIEKKLINLRINVQGNICRWFIIVNQ